MSFLFSRKKIIICAAYDNTWTRQLNLCVYNPVDEIIAVYNPVDKIQIAKSDASSGENESNETSCHDEEAPSENREDMKVLDKKLRKINNTYDVYNHVFSSRIRRALLSFVYVTKMRKVIFLYGF